MIAQIHGHGLVSCVLKNKFLRLGYLEIASLLTQLKKNLDWYVFVYYNFVMIRYFTSKLSVNWMHLNYVVIVLRWFLAQFREDCGRLANFNDNSRNIWALTKLFPFIKKLLQRFSIQSGKNTLSSLFMLL